jgi:hypothetical protein
MDRQNIVQGGTGLNGLYPTVVADNDDYDDKFTLLFTEIKYGFRMRCM